ncbi:CDP-glycerol glycerophosphotransferase family protein [Brumicola nitratireducens]|uniref:CDP-glycerol:poly(Glycerophosphate) glycerophosphotransferase n=1 Tax=Glaciecola nitratireducens (strain JCM 12485 / KCTC 12276 / FR1064) TaxID=1085623 RepID=G4QET9_GLANF|nr:CDP-glycerol glycerophosphotransferase family protein [Glaciecola nitratireducens]AEP28202.1 CDP-glycerol:poly(glycerophosphate) glycerophosphotransferase [Glaciecola nitratireducens FR1064]
MKTVHFDLLHLYYLPQFLPVAQVLSSRGTKVRFVIYDGNDVVEITKKALDAEGFDYVVVSDEKQALEYYVGRNPNWIIFGKSPSSNYTVLKETPVKIAFMQHGIGPKSCYYSSSEFPFDVRFVEGDTRKQRLQEMFPDSNFVDVGYAKLDPLFNNEKEQISLLSLGLDPSKKTLLYAPTFYPSSIECFSKNWPQELSNYNLIIKPHFFSLTKLKYAKQRAILEAWSAYENVYLCSLDCYSLLPFMKISDVLLSEASSTIFEFAAIDKPVVWCDFYHIRWSYRGLFKFRFAKRIDKDISLFEQLCDRAKSPSEVLSKVNYCLANKDEKSALREEITLSMAGKTDGKCSERIVNFLLAD